MISVLNCLHRSHLGGAQRRVVWVATELSKMNINTIVLFPDDDSDIFAGYLQQNGLPFIRICLHPLRGVKHIINNLLFFLELPVIVIKLIGIIRHNKINIVHVNGVTNIQPVLAALFCNTHVLWHWNDMLTPKLFIKTIQPLLHSKLITLAVATPAICKHYHLALKGTCILPAPIPSAAYEINHSNLMNAFSIRRDLVPEGTTVIGFFSNLLEKKGASEFVKAAIVLCQDSKKTHAVIIGGTLPGHEKFVSSLKQQVKLHHCEGSIHFAGFHENIPQLIHELDVFVFPSHSEACPIVVLQAMQTGVPIVATSVGDVPRMLRGSPLPLVEPSDIDMLHQTILAALKLSRKQKLAMAELMKQRVCSEYSLDLVVHKHFELYQSIYQKIGKVYIAHVRGHNNNDS